MSLITGEDAFRTLVEALTAAGCSIPEKESTAEHEATRRWNGALEPRPALVTRCSTANQVSAALRAAREAGVPVSVHNGGQDWVGRAFRNDGLVLDLSAMTEVSIDESRCEAVIGGGVTVGQINQAAGVHGLVAVIGNDGAVGMAGLMLGGGYGPLMNRFGLACDNLLSAELVLPDGAIATCDGTKHSELFWALRGGGGNFGVVTSARIRLHRADPVFVGNIIFDWSDAHAALGRFAELMGRASAGLFGAAILSLGPGGKPVVVISLNWTGDLDQGKAVFAEISSTGRPVLAESKSLPAVDLLSLTDGKLAQGKAYEVATRWFDILGPDAVNHITDAFEQRTSPLSTIIIHHCHGVATEVPPGATAFGMRKPHFTALIYGTWMPGDGDAERHRGWVRQTDATLVRSALPGGYANLLPDEAVDQIAHAFGGNGSRLAQLKNKFDPQGVLRALPLPQLVNR